MFGEIIDIRKKFAGNQVNENENDDYLKIICKFAVIKYLFHTTMNTFLQLLWTILKDILSIVFLILQSLCKLIVKISILILNLAKKAFAIGQEKLAQAKEQLPGQIERGKEAMQTAHQKLQEVKDNWPAQMDAVKQWAQESGKNITEASKAMSESLQKEMNSAHTRLVSLRESMNNPQPETINDNANNETPRQLRWKKEYTWAVVVIVLIIGAVNAVHKNNKSDSYSGSYTAPASQSSSTLYNNSGTSSQSSSSSAEEEALRAQIWAEQQREMAEDMKAEQERQRIERIEEKERERQRDAEIKAMEAENKRKREEMTRERIKNSMSTYGL